VALAAYTRYLHAQGMVDEPLRFDGRRSEIATRLGAIRTRAQELEERNDAARRRVTPGEWQARMDAAQRHAAAAQASAKQALAYSAAALRNAADAHDRAAAEHEKAAASAAPVLNERHRGAAAMHRAAAITDRQRAARVRSFLSGTDLAEPGIGTGLQAT
jgi:hypothetical protein